MSGHHKKFTNFFFTLVFNMHTIPISDRVVFAPVDGVHIPAATSLTAFLAVCMAIAFGLMPHTIFV